MAVDVPVLENFIGGGWTPASGSDAVEDRNPADPSDVLARVPLSSEKDVESAVTAAQEALPAWRAMSPVRRGQIVVRAGRLLEARADELAQLITRLARASAAPVGRGARCRVRRGSGDGSATRAVRSPA